MWQSYDDRVTPLTGVETNFNLLQFGCKTSERISALLLHLTATKTIPFLSPSIVGTHFSVNPHQNLAVGVPKKKVWPALYWRGAFWRDPH